MTDKEKDNLFYVCSLIEYTGRKTKNKRGAVVQAIGKAGIEKQLHDAEVNHCLSFDQVSDELIEQYHIQEGELDTITDCKYKIPNYLDIGRLYSFIIMDCAKSGQEIDELMSLFKSFISDEISNFKTGVYYQNPEYLVKSYQEGYLLE